MNIYGNDYEAKVLNMFDNIKAIGDIQKLKQGKIVYLSDSQIVSCIINLPDASKNLSGSTYKELFCLFNEYQKSKQKRETTIASYYDRCFNIIAEFEKIAPYSFYCGDNSKDTILYIQQTKEKNKNIANTIADRYINIINAVAKYLSVQNKHSFSVYYTYSSSYFLYITIMLHTTYGYSKYILDTAYEKFSDIVLAHINEKYNEFDFKEEYNRAIKVMGYEHQIAYEKNDQFEDYIKELTSAFIKHAGLKNDSQSSQIICDTIISFTYSIK